MISQRRRQVLERCTLLLRNQQVSRHGSSTDINNSLGRSIMMVASGNNMFCECASTTTSAAVVEEASSSSLHRIIIPKISSNKPFYPCSGGLGPFRHHQKCRKYNSSSSSSGNDEISGIPGGADLLSPESSSTGTRRKIILESYAPSGIDVTGLVCVGGDANSISNNENEEQGDLPGMSKVVHMNGSILAFPNMCFLWNVKHSHEVTMDSLAPIRLYTPSIQYLFLGCDTPFPSSAMISKIKKEMKTRHDIVMESMDVMNAMGTFNILNGEDRRVACAIVMNVDE